MTKTINFLRNQQEKIRQQARRKLFAQISALSVLIIFAVVVVATFSVYFVLTSEAKSLDAKIKFQKDRINAKAATETKQFYLKEKSNNLAGIMVKSRNHQSIVDGIFSILPKGVEIDNVSIDESGVITFIGKTQDFASLDVLLENIKNESLGAHKIYHAEVRQIGYSWETGDYKFNLLVYLNPIVVGEQRK